MNNAISALPHFRRMGHQDEGGAVFAVKSLQKVHDVCGRFAIEVAGWFIGPDKGRIIHQRPRDCDSLLLPPGEFERSAMQLITESN